MIRKRVLAGLLAVVLVFCLTGCMEIRLEDKISKNGTYTELMVVYLDREAVVDYLKKSLGEEYVDYFNDLMEEQGLSLRTVDGKEYFVSKPQTERSNIVKSSKNNQTRSVKGSIQIWETGVHIDLKALLGDATGSLDSLDSLPADDVDDQMVKEEYEKMLASSYVVYTISFDYDIVKTDKNGTINKNNPKQASWKISLDPAKTMPVIEAYCKSDIKVSGVVQGATYKKAKKVKFQGAASATYKGKKVKSGTTFKKHGQHTLILKAASGEQRTVTFFIDKKKPVVRGVKNKKTYKKSKYIYIDDEDSGIASIKINGKKKNPEDSGFTIKKKGTNTIVVKDKVGNTTKIKVKIKPKKSKKKSKKSKKK